MPGRAALRSVRARAAPVDEAGPCTLDQETDWLALPPELLVQCLVRLEDEADLWCCYLVCKAWLAECRRDRVRTGVLVPLGLIAGCSADRFNVASLGSACGLVPVRPGGRPGPGSGCGSASASG